MRFSNPLTRIFKSRFFFFVLHYFYFKKLSRSLNRLARHILKNFTISYLEVRFFSLCLSIFISKNLLGVRINMGISSGVSPACFFIINLKQKFPYPLDSVTLHPRLLHMCYKKSIIKILFRLLISCKNSGFLLFLGKVIDDNLQTIPQFS